MQGVVGVPTGSGIFWQEGGWDAVDQIWVKLGSGAAQGFDILVCKQHADDCG
jgi:hypothetical protein